MPIIFNSVSAFVEQVGRRIISKYGDLDRLTCIYNGPASGALNFKPTVNSPHPDYPLMFVTDSSAHFVEALIAEVEVTYVGILQTSGVNKYITYPIATQSMVKGSRDHTEFVTIMTQVPHYVVTGTGPGGQTTTGYVGALYNFGTRQITVYYIGTEASIRYQAYPQPTSLNYESLGLSLANFKQILELRGPISISASGLDSNALAQAETQAGPLNIPTLQVINLGFEFVQQGRWYTCTETYGPAFLVQGVPT